MSSKRELEISAANDRVQQAQTPEETRAILKSLPLDIVRGIADLNYCDYEASRAQMTREIVDSKF